MRVAIIPARGGSTRIPRKNIKLFHGKPIIAYSIETARASDLFDEIFVSTDDFDIAAVAEQYGAHALSRPTELAANEAGTQAVMQWVLRGALKKPPTPIDFACCIYATSPMMTVSDLTRGLLFLDLHAGMRYSFSVGQNPLRDAGNWYWGTVGAFMNGTPVHDQFSVMVPIPAERCIDINTPEDWTRAEEMYARLHNIETRSQAMERVGL